MKKHIIITTVFSLIASFFAPIFWDWYKFKFGSEPVPFFIVLCAISITNIAYILFKLTD